MLGKLYYIAKLFYVNTRREFSSLQNLAAETSQKMATGTALLKR